ncbi:MAG TPA: carboxypeptidase M32 [Thermohalobaculum sp.]|nr:carboxypeptidase M32 [Thermohalobaculum sp.]
MTENGLSPDAPAAARAAFDALMAHLRQLFALDRVRDLLSWDQETMMPPRGAAARAEHAAAVEAACHRLRTDPRVAEWLGVLEPETTHLGPAARANLREARRIHDRAMRVPESLAAASAHAAARGQATWSNARRANRFADFAPVLAEIVDLKRHETRCLAGPDAGPDALYDALLDDFEPGARVAELAPLLAGLRPRLTSLRQRIAEKVASRGNAPAVQPMPAEAQMALSRQLCQISGFSWESGRLDLAEHPFSLGFGGGDVRISTRIRAEAPWESLYGTMHELGHGLYDMGIGRELDFTPAGRSASMGVDESQSRLWENQIGRSRAFCSWLAPRIAAGGGGPADPDRLYAAVNRVEPGFIRTEADEVHYNLHILLRLDIERAIIAGDFGVDDLDAEWTSRFERDFGFAPPDAVSGVLQDVHWSVGLFGYFPTYSLGNIYGASLALALRHDLPDLDEYLAEGDLAPARAWLCDKVHRHGRLKSPAEIIEQATGAPPSAEPLLSYLEEKYGELYGL